MTWRPAGTCCRRKPTRRNAFAPTSRGRGIRGRGGFWTWGAAPGILLPHLLELYPGVRLIVEMDYAEEMLIENARKSARTAARWHLRADIAFTPFVVPTFDLILCFCALPHFGDPRARTEGPGGSFTTREGSSPSATSRTAGLSTNSTAVWTPRLRTIALPPGSRAGDLTGRGGGDRPDRGGREGLVLCAGGKAKP